MKIEFCEAKGSSKISGEASINDSEASRAIGFSLWYFRPITKSYLVIGLFPMALDLTISLCQNV